MSNPNPTTDRISILHSHLLSFKPSSSLPSLIQYRKLSTINNEALKNIIFGSYSSYRDLYFSYIINDSLFKHHTSLELNRDGQRRLAFRQMVSYFKKLGIKFEDFERDPPLASIAGDCLFSFDAGTAIKFGVHSVLYAFAIYNLGTEKHRKYIDRAMNLDDIGSFSLTELGHGSNARDITTTAHYDPSTEEFVLNTPNDLGMKFWIGATADLANMSVVWAQLIIGEKGYGPHLFLVPLRDLRDHTMCPGVLIGDCGSKNGCNSIDNGFLIFKNYRVSRENLLDKYSQVARDGTFTTGIPNSDKRFGIQLGSLAGGRINLALNSTSQLTNAVTIATRFAASRLQFGPPGKPEQPILEYQIVQYNLIPIISSAIVFKVSSMSLIRLWAENKDTFLNDYKNPLVGEFHALASVLKALATWNAVKGIQKCREICGGLGYSAYNRLGALLADTDVCQTFEGENTVLIQQTAKFLIDVVRDLLKGKQRTYKSTYWLELSPVNEEKADFKEKNDLYNEGAIKKILEHRCNLTLQESGLKLQENVGIVGDPFSAWNETQIFYLQNTARAFGELWCFNENLTAIENCKCEKTKIVFKKFVFLWALTKIQEDIAVFRDNDFIDTNQYKMIKEIILDLVKELKNEAVGIIDAIAPPEEIIGSPLAAANGDIYNKFLNTVMTAPGCFEKVKWWREIHGNK